jgi:hypothetical protein
MANKEERLRVLRMIQEGKLSPDEAAGLLEALDETNAPSRAEYSTTASSVAAKSNRWFRVRVTDTNTGKTRVNVRMPISVVNAGLKMGVKFAPQVEGLDPEILMQLINDGELGQIVDVFDDEDGEHVEVFIE